MPFTSLIFGRRDCTPPKTVAWFGMTAGWAGNKLGDTDWSRKTTSCVKLAVGCNGQIEKDQSEHHRR